MRVMIRYASGLGLLMLWGCGEMSLAEMKAPQLDVYLQSSYVDDGVMPYITLGEGESGDCHEMSSAMRAFMNGAEVPLKTPGGQSSGGLGKPSGCIPSTFFDEKKPLPTPGPTDVTRFRITEGSTTFVAETEALCGPRSLKLSAPAGSAVHGGQEVELEWLPATDVLLLQRVSVTTRDRNFELSRASGAVQVDGTRIRFQMPPLSAVDSGEARIALIGDNNFGLYDAGPTRCEGFAQCRFRCFVPDVPWFVTVTLQGG